MKTGILGVCVEGESYRFWSTDGSARTVLQAGAGVAAVRDLLLPRKSVLLTGKAKRPSRENSGEFGYLLIVSLMCPDTHHLHPPSLPLSLPSFIPLSH